MLTAYRHHAVIPNSTLQPVEADQRHRDRVITEHVHPQDESVPLARLPSGAYTTTAP